MPIPSFDQSDCVAPLDFVTMIDWIGIEIEIGCLWLIHRHYLSKFVKADAHQVRGYSTASVLLEICHPIHHETTISRFLYSVSLMIYKSSVRRHSAYSSYRLNVCVLEYTPSVFMKLSICNVSGRI